MVKFCEDRLTSAGVRIGTSSSAGEAADIGSFGPGASVSRLVIRRRRRSLAKAENMPIGALAAFGDDRMEENRKDGGDLFNELAEDEDSETEDPSSQVRP